MKPLPSAKRLSELLSYDPETGVFMRRFKNGVVRRVGLTCVGGYLGIKIDGDFYYAHRLAWACHHGQDLPQGMQIDHINNIKSDNRIVNLRLATPTENFWNKGLYKRNTSGYKGVSCRKKNITVTVGRRTVSGFPSMEDASDFRELMVSLMHGDFANHVVRVPT